MNGETIYIFINEYFFVLNFNPSDCFLERSRTSDRKVHILSWLKSTVIIDWTIDFLVFYMRVRIFSFRI